MSKSIRAIKLTTQNGDWEGFYVDGMLISENTTLGEGDSDTFLWDMAVKYCFTKEQYLSEVLNDFDTTNLYECGNFPINLSELTGDYINK